MAHTIAAVAVYDRGRYLLIQEKLEKCYGEWTWPAGHVDPGETPEQAAVREAKEEAGIDVVLGEKIGEWYDEDAARTRILFAAKSFSGELVIQSGEILGAAWFTKQEIITMRESLRNEDWILKVTEDEND